MSGRPNRMTSRQLFSED